MKYVVVVQTENREGRRRGFQASTIKGVVQGLLHLAWVLPVDALAKKSLEKTS